MGRAAKCRNQVVTERCLWCAAAYRCGKQYLGVASPHYLAFQKEVVLPLPREKLTEVRKGAATFRTSRQIGQQPAGFVALRDGACVYTVSRKEVEPRVEIWNCGSSTVSSSIGRSSSSANFGSQFLRYFLGGTFVPNLQGSGNHS